MPPPALTILYCCSKISMHFHFWALVAPLKVVCGSHWGAGSSPGDCKNSLYGFCPDVWGGCVWHAHKLPQVWKSCSESTDSDLGDNFDSVFLFPAQGFWWGSLHPRWSRLVEKERKLCWTVKTFFIMSTQSWYVWLARWLFLVGQCSS